MSQGEHPGGRPAIRLSGPCVEAPDVPALVRFYERFLGWEVEALVGPRDDRPPGWGWGRLRPADKAPAQKIEVQWQEHYQPPAWPGRPGRPSMQWHLDWWVEDLGARVRGGGGIAAAAGPQPGPAPDHAGPRRPPVLPLDLSGRPRRGGP